MRNIVFLDIDGVVNTIQIDTKPYKNKRRKQGKFYFDICSPGDKRISNRQAIMWLNKLCIETKAEIVISSTWRISLDLEELKETLINSGLLPEIKVIGTTPLLNDQIRGEEINAYLQENKDISAFVILDDDVDMGDLKEYLVQTNTYVGFTYNEYLKAKKIFEKK